MKAYITYDNGHLLVLPISNNAPLLFLEWVASFNAAQCPIHKVIRNTDLNTIDVRLYGTKKEVYESALQYINANI